MKKQKEELIEKRREFMKNWRQENRKITEDWMKDYEVYRSQLISEGKPVEEIDHIAKEIQAMDTRWENTYLEEMRQLDQWKL